MALVRVGTEMVTAATRPVGEDDPPTPTHVRLAY